MRKQLRSQGFALPTVIISSVVLFAVLVAALGAVASIGVALRTQYYEALASDASESGAVRAAGCIRNGTYAINTPITPATDCLGAVVTGQSLYEINSSAYRTTYVAKISSSVGQTQTVDIQGSLQRVRASTSVVFATNINSRKLKVAMILDPNGDRVSQRFWYFGDRVMFDFGTGGNTLPTISRNAASSTPPPLANEGTTVVTDAAGNLQFWSNGMTIWNKSGNIMQNGSGLSGGSSSTQAVASFPLNSSRTMYAVISNSGQAENGVGQLYLSIVDLTLNSGDGAVTSLNQPLGSGKYADEGLGAMPNSDGTGYYVFAYDSTTAKITSFLIKTDGSVQGPFITSLSPAPLICQAFTYVGSNNLTGYGAFNFTKGYDKLLLLVGARKCSGTNTGTAYVFGTNLNTGALTLQASWTTNAVGNGGSGYTADFSPGEKYVYVSSIYPGNLTRYNIQDLSSVPSTEWTIGGVTNDTDPALVLNSGGQVRRGPDGRMYLSDRARYSTASTPCYVSYINNPDAPTNSVADIGLNIDGLTMPTGTCSIWGLPQMATVFKPQEIFY